MGEVRSGGLSRRGFIGAAAGTAAATAGATALGTGSRASAESDPNAKDHSTPKWRIGVQMFTARGSQVMGSGSPTQSNLEKTRAVLDQMVRAIPVGYGNVAVESYGNNYGNVGGAGTGADSPAVNGPVWRQEVESRGGYCWGDHNGGNLGVPPAMNVGAINTALTRMHALGTVEVGNAGTGTVGFTGDGANFNVDMALDAANRMNHWGQWLQQGDAIGGVTMPGIAGARYYHHPHQNEWRRVRGDDDPDGPPTYSGQPEWINRQLMEVLFANLDPEFGFIQADLSWARHNVALNNNELYIDILTEYEEQIESYHVKGQAGLSEVDCNLPPFTPGEAGSSTDPVTGAEVLGNPGDLVPWQDVFDTMRWPDRKTFLWERDGATSLAAHNLAISRFSALLHNAVFDRSIIGAPANVSPPSQFSPPAHDKWYMVRGTDTGTWVRTRGKPFSYQWLRNGTQVIRGATNQKYYVRPQDAGWELQCAVIAENNAGSTDELTENPALVVSG
jgi:hypothetical protein